MTTIATPTTDELLTIQELAGLLKIPVNTIYDWNRKGTGPRRVKVGSAVRYRRSDVEHWLRERTK